MGEISKGMHYLLDVMGDRLVDDDARQPRVRLAQFEEDPQGPEIGRCDALRAELASAQNYANIICALAVLGVFAGPWGAAAAGVLCSNLQLGVNILERKVASVCGW